MEDSGRFRARIPRGLGLMEDTGRFLSRIPRGLGLMEDSGRFLARIPRGGGGGGRVNGGFRKVPSQNT